MKEIFNLLLNYKITPNEFYLLISMKDGITPPFMNVGTELRLLKVGEWVTADNKITEKSYLMLNDIESQVKVNKKKTSSQVLGPKAEDNVNAYLAMWPKGKLPSGKPARAAASVLQANFTWFFNNHKYSWEIILKATAHYLDEFEKKNYLYMRTSQYFISKMSHDKIRESELANYCALIETGDDIDDTPKFSERVV